MSRRANFPDGFRAGSNGCNVEIPSPSALMQYDFFSSPEGGSMSESGAESVYGKGDRIKTEEEQHGYLPSEESGYRAKVEAKQDEVKYECSMHGTIKEEKRCVKQPKKGEKEANDEMETVVADEPVAEFGKETELSVSWDSQSMRMASEK